MRCVEGRYVDRVESDGTLFHYTWMTTAAYRGRFGTLDYEYDRVGRGGARASLARVATVDGARAALPRALQKVSRRRRVRQVRYLSRPYRPGQDRGPSCRVSPRSYWARLYWARTAF